MKLKRRNVSYSSLLYIFAVFYGLFAFRRIKAQFMPYLNGGILNNMILIVPLLVLIIIVMRKNCLLNIRILISLILMLSAATIGLFFARDMYQSVYAILLCFVPIGLFLCMDEHQYQDFEKLVDVFILFGTVYSILTIVASLNYSSLLSLIGVAVHNNQFSGQYRASLMLGSGITVSYYLNITLPLIMYRYCTTTKGKNFLIIAMILNMVALLIENSRLAVLTMVFEFAFFIFAMQKKDKQSIRTKVYALLLIIVGIGFALKFIDVSRLFIGFSDESTTIRMNVLKLGFHIFKKNPITGMGLGTYFYRAWGAGGGTVTADGITATINPHNSQVMLLSELGIVGFLAFYVIFFVIFNKIRHIKNEMARKTGILIGVSYFLGSLGGTQLFDEISFSVIAWTYFGLFYTYAIYECEENE